MRRIAPLAVAAVLGCLAVAGCLQPEPAADGFVLVTVSGTVERSDEPGNVTPVVCEQFPGHRVDFANRTLYVAPGTQPRAAFDGARLVVSRILRPPALGGITPCDDIGIAVFHAPHARLGLPLGDGSRLPQGMTVDNGTVRLWDGTTLDAGDRAEVTVNASLQRPTGDPVRVEATLSVVHHGSFSPADVEVSDEAFALPWGPWQGERTL